MLAVCRENGGENCNVSFVSVKRKLDDIVLHWLSTLPPKGKRFVVIDPILATGKTVCSIVQAISARNPNAEISILCCYGAPDGIDNLLSSFPYVRLYVALQASGVDSSGYVQPVTNGDIGDKLYGIKCHG